MNGSTSLPLEIERKFLIRRPSAALLAEKSTRILSLRQTYLRREADGAGRRVRRSEEGGVVRYIFTSKQRLTDLTRIEREREITPEEYAALLSEADETRRPIEKTRYCVPYAGHTLEIDLFPFWPRQAFCEAELKSEDEELLLPDWIEVLREVTADERYTNRALARAIPPEDGIPLDFPREYGIISLSDAKDGEIDAR